MKDFTLAEIAKACNGEYVGDESLRNTKITSVERDSRQVKNGSLFLAIKGERVDGHDFIENALRRVLCVHCARKLPKMRQSLALSFHQHLMPLRKSAGHTEKNSTFPLSEFRAASEKLLQKKCSMPFFHRSSRPTKHKAISITSSVFR